MVLAVATVLATGGVLGLGLPPAAAHVCARPDEIPVARAATIDVGVTVEDATVPDVEIRVPSGLRLDRVDPVPGWTFTRSGSTVRFRGGPFLPFTCEFFSLGVTAPVAGAFGITVIQRNAAGAVVARAVPDPNSPTDRVLDQFVYAGVKPPPVPGTSSGPSVVVIGGIVLVGLGVVMGVVAMIRGRRGPGDDESDEGGEGDDESLDPELQARLERFKKKKPDPRPPE